MRRLLLVAGVLLLVTSCEMGPGKHDLLLITHRFDFSESAHGWLGDFADYPVGDSIAYGLYFGHDPLPPNLGAAKGLKISGTNYNDDLFMFVKKKIDGLQPSTTYEVAFQIKFATNASKSQAGVDGSPGESVYLKAGAAPMEPLKVAVNGYYRMNIDKGNQLSGGQHMAFLGNVVSNGQTFEYSVVERNNAASFKATTNSDGELWLIVGTDSGFEGTTTLYYTSITALLTLAD
jgi:hypothetical protein